MNGEIIEGVQGLFRLSDANTIVVDGVGYKVDQKVYDGKKRVKLCNNPVSNTALGERVGADALVVVKLLSVSKSFIVTSYIDGKNLDQKVKREMYKHKEQILQLLLWLLRYEKKCGEKILDQLENSNLNWYPVVLPRWCPNKAAVKAILKYC